MTTALARLIKEAPDIARAVMQVEGVTRRPAFGTPLGLFKIDGSNYETSEPPAWFYSAVAGKLAEWLIERGCRIRPVVGKRDRVLVEMWSDGKFVRDVRGPTFLDALVEAAIVVGREGSDEADTTR